MELNLLKMPSFALPADNFERNEYAHLEQELNPALAQAKVAKLVAASNPYAARAPRGKKFTSAIERAEYGLPSEAKKMGVSDALYGAYLRALNNPDNAMFHPNEVWQAVQKDFVATPLFKEFKDTLYRARRSDEEAFLRPKKFARDPGYDLWLNAKKVKGANEGTSTPSLGSLATAGLIGAGVGAASGAIFGGLGALPGTVLGGVGGVVGELASHKLRNTEWARAQSDSPRWSDRRGVDVVDLGMNIVGGAGAERLTAKGLRALAKKASLAVPAAPATPGPPTGGPLLRPKPPRQPWEEPGLGTTPSGPRSEGTPYETRVSSVAVPGKSESFSVADLEKEMREMVRAREEKEALANAKQQAKKEKLNAYATMTAEEEQLYRGILDKFKAGNADFTPGELAIIEMLRAE